MTSGVPSQYVVRPTKLENFRRQEKEAMFGLGGSVVWSIRLSPPDRRRSPLGLNGSGIDLHGCWGISGCKLASAEDGSERSYIQPERECMFHVHVSKEIS